MLKTRKLISLLLVVSMLVSVFSVALVSTSAAATGNVAVTAAQPSATITAGGESQSFHVGDTIKYTYYMNASDISPNGKISGVDAAVYYDESILKFTGDREEICPNLLDPKISTAEDVHNGIKFNDSNVGRGFKFNSDDKVLVELTFEVIAEGTTDVYTHIETLYAVYDTEVAIFIQQGEVTDKGAPAVSDEVVLVNCPHPTEAETTAPVTEVTEATEPATTEPVPSDKAVVTLYALDGTFETKTFDIGDEFTVYTMLNSSANDDGKISTVAGEQYYTKEILQRMDALDDEDLIDDVETVFPILSQANVIGNGMDEGALYFSGSNASKKKPYMFDNDSCKLVVTQYKVTAGGTAEVRTNLKTLALTDDYLTRVVDKYVVQPGMEINFYSSFTDPDAPVTEATTAPETQPTETTAPETQPTETTAPETQPTETTAPETQPTETTAPETQPTETTAPETQPAQTTATVTIYALDGTSKTETFNVGDEFTVYTMMNVADQNDGKIGALSGQQTYTDSVINLTDAYNGEGEVENLTAMFPITGEKSLAKADEPGTIYFNAGTPDGAFVFDSDDDELIVTNYKVVAPGTAEVRTSLKTLALADEDLTKVIDKGEGITPDGDVSFTEPEHPTTAPETQPTETTAPETQPTETTAPETQPTETTAPETQPVVPTETQAPADKAVVTLYALDGTFETKTFDIGDEFTVYTMLNSSANDDGKISTVAGEQYYTKEILQRMDALDDEDLIDDVETVFPILSQANVIGNGMDEGALYFSGSNASKKKPYMFDNDSCKLVVTQYKVTAGGTAEVRTNLKTLALTDDYLTRVVDKYVVQDGMEINFYSSFTDPDAPVTEATTTPETQPTETTAPETQPTETTAPETQPTETTAPETKPTETTAPETKPTETTAPADKAVVTLYALDGTFETKTFDIGDEFTVYTMLNSSANDDGKISTVAGEQYYTKEILQRMDALDDEDLIDDVETVFPILSQANVIGNGMDEGALYFSGSNASKKKPYMFDNDSCKLVVTQYKVTAGGTAEVRTNLKTLALTDDYLTRVVDKYVVQPGMEINFYSSFTDPDAPVTEATTAPETQAPETQAPETQAPETQAPETQAPETQAPETQAPETQAPETQAPETQAPETQAPETQPAQTTATVTIYALDGTSKTETFNVGDSFTVYTMMNVADQNDGKIGALSGQQTYTDSVINLTDAYNGEGEVENLTAMFPITGEKSLAKADEPGTIYFNAGTPDGAFVFDSDDDELIVTNYKVVAPGTAEVRTSLKTLALADEDLTKVIDKGEGITPDGDVSFTEPEHPSTAPETQAPETQAPETQAPETQAPETQAPETQAPETTAPQTKATVVIYDIYGAVVDTREYNVGDEFTVYTIMNAKDINGGKIGSISGDQTYTDTVVALTDAHDAEGAVTDLNTMFPVTKEATMANAAESGILHFNASTPYITNPFMFDQDTSKLIVTNYKVTAPGTAEIKTTLKTVALADEELTRIVNKGEILDDKLKGIETFDDPGEPTYPVIPTETQAPETQAPETQAPETQAPETQAPETQAPETQAPETQAPETQAPETQAPETQAPETQAPETQAPETQAPETQAPETQAPETQAPETQAPETQAPETQAPETQAPETQAPVTTATVKIFSFDNKTDTPDEVKTFNIGDTFTVYTILNAANVNNGEFASINASQDYTDSILSLKKDTAEDEMFPILKNGSVVVNTDQDGKILYNASAPELDKPFVFAHDYDVVIATTYTVTKSGDAEIRNHIKSLAAADLDLTRVVKNDEPVGEVDLDEITTFTQPVVPTTAPETQAPETQAPETQAPETQAPETQAPETQAPETQAPETQAPVTQAPETQAPVTQAPETQAPETQAPETQAPETQAPETQAPETQAPETQAPETQAPETQAPETQAPETQAPETQAPETQPATHGPEQEIDPTKVYINADGDIYEVNAGGEYTYTYYLSNGGLVAGVDATTKIETPVLTMLGEPEYPLLTGGTVVDNKFDDGAGNVNELHFTYSSAYGADFSSNDSKLVTFTVKVDENAEPGIYKIFTKVNTLADENEEKQIFNGTDVTPDKITRREGVVDGTWIRKDTTEYTATNGEHTIGDTADLLFTVNGAKDDELTYDKFRALYIDDQLVGFANYDTASGSLKLTLKAGYMDTLTVGEHIMKYVFSDGTALGTLTIKEKATETTAPSSDSTETSGTDATGGTVAATSATSSQSTTTNSSAVQTGSPATALVFVAVLIMAAGIIIFAKKKRED